MTIPDLKPGNRVHHGGSVRVVSHVVLRGPYLYVSLMGVSKPVHVDEISHDWREIRFDAQHAKRRHQQ